MRTYPTIDVSAASLNCSGRQARTPPTTIPGGTCGIDSLTLTRPVACGGARLALGQAAAGGGAGAGFEGGAVDRAEALVGILDSTGVVRHSGVRQQVAARIVNTALDRVLGKVQADEAWCRGWHVRLLRLG
jgi:hypothetical protein